MKMQFFDKFSRFYTTSKTSPFPHRLNGRYEAIIAENVDLLAGAKILDIASHDGRWTFAALQAGASYVKGIEARQELIDNASETFDYYGIASTRYDFECGDVFDLLSSKSFDVVLCLGFFYHTIRHAELLDRIDRTGARFIIVDTEVIPTSDQMPVRTTDDDRLVYNNPYSIQLFREPVVDEQMACHDSLTRDGYTVVGRPSRAAIQYLSNHFGYSCKHYDWHSHFVRNPERAPSMPDYYQGWRDTFYLSKP
jgi:protein-L-isoaspartate O-methyltransferase